MPVKDVQQILDQYEHATEREPMHGQPGQIRRAPSTDQKRQRREMQRKAMEDHVTETQSRTAVIANLLGQAQRAATLPEREALMLQVEQLRTQAAREADAEAGYLVAEAKIHDTLVPGHNYERMSAETDWILGLDKTADAHEASNEMVAQASLWFARCAVKDYPEEFGEQARNMAHHLGSQWGDKMEVAEQAFLTEATRLHTLAVRSGQVTIATEAAYDPEVGGFAYDAASEAVTDPTAPRRTHAAMVAEMLQREAASSLPQVADGALPPDQFSTLQGQTSLPPEATSSERAPAIQEIENYKGWDGSSVVPTGPTNAAADNAGDIGTQDDAHPSAGFPVGASIQHTAHKESHMAQRQCPTCGGHGKVAVQEPKRIDYKQANSTLPQIDQIVNADDTPGTSEFPAQVAWPIQGGGWDPNVIPNAISQAEQSIKERNSKSPLASSAAQRVANGRDNSGWMGDNGAKGTDYPGYSTPNYGGQDNLGMPDPVYGEGGDNGNQPLKPFGAQEANDYTNDPGQNWQPGQPTQADTGAATVGPTMNDRSGMTGTASRNPYIAAAQQEILRQQAIIRQHTGR